MWTLQGISPVTTLLLCNISENFFLTNTSLNIHMIWVPFHCIVINWYQWDHCVYVKKVMWQKSLDYWPHGLSWMCIVQYHTYMFSTIKGLSSIWFQNIQDDNLFLEKKEQRSTPEWDKFIIYYFVLCWTQSLANFSTNLWISLSILQCLNNQKALLLLLTNFPWLRPLSGNSRIHKEFAFFL